MRFMLKAKAMLFFVGLAMAGLYGLMVFAGCAGQVNNPNPDASMDGTADESPDGSLDGSADADASGDDANDAGVTDNGDLGDAQAADSDGEVQPDNSFYVATDGDDNQSGSIDHPWRTIQKAADTLEPGDTVFVRAGTYHELVSVHVSGAPGQLVQFANYPGESATIDGSGLSFSEGGLVSLQSVQYVRVSGLKVINSDNFGILVQRSQHIIIENNQTRETHSSGVASWSSSDVIVASNTVVNARNVPLEQGGHEECISIASTDNFEVRNNEVYYDGMTGYLGGAGIDIKESSRQGSVHHNYVHDVTEDGGIYLDAWTAGLNGTPTLNHVEVFANRVHNCGSGVAVGSESGGTAENIKVYNNVLTRLSYCGIIVSSTSLNGPRKNIQFFNNTIYESVGNGGAGIYIVSSNVENITIRNNIVSFGPKWQGEIVVTSADILPKVIADHNLIFGPTKCSQAFPACQEVPNSIAADPLFLDALSYDLCITGTSPAMDAGADLTAEGVLVDYFGTARPQGPGFDIGAYELVK